MQCPDCNGQVATFDVPEDLREHLPKPVPTAGLCTRCLALHPTDEGGDPEFTDLEAFPEDPDAAISLAIAIGLLDSLALNRASIETLFRRVAEAGEDPFLALDRLSTSGAVQPRVDLVARKQQIEQLMSS
jgi:hypothetical protein